MIIVTVGNGVDRKSVHVDPNKTLRDILEENEIDYSRNPVMLDGSTIGAGDLDKTFTSYGITDRCYLMVVAKANGAMA